MAFTDVVIQRLRANGVTVHDIRGNLPTNLNNWNGRRAISAITGIAIHHDAQFRSDYYDSVARYIQEAQYHIDKDWGGGWHGNGLQYHLKMDNVGDVFVCRDFEMLLWHCTDGNDNYLGFCLDGLRQPLTHEMATSMKKTLDVLCTMCPEFPASQGDIRAHREIPSNSTECCGDPMVASPVVEYRNTGNINADAFAWNDPPAPAPAPAPTPPPKPTPTPTPPAPQDPEWKRNLKDIPDAVLYAKQDGIALINMETGAIVRNDYKKGDKFTIVYGTSIGGSDYVLTQYSIDNKKPWGIRSIDLLPNDPNYVPPTPPVPNPSDYDKKQDDQIKALTDLVNKIKDFINGFFKGRL